MSRHGRTILARFAAAAAIVAPPFAAVLRAAPEVPAPPPRVVRFMGERAPDVLRSATRVEVFALSGKRLQDPPRSVGGYAVGAVGKEQGEDFARRLAAVLLDEKSYRFDVRHVEPFRPSIGLRVSGPGGAVEVLLSQATDELVVFCREPVDGSVRSAKSDAAPAKASLAALINQALPAGGTPVAPPNGKRRHKTADEDDESSP